MNPTNTSTRRFALFTAISEIHDSGVYQNLMASYLPPLRNIGAEPWEPGMGKITAPLVVFVATGGTEQLILQNAHFDAHEPALLIAHPGSNSLPAALEVLARLQQMGTSGQIHYLCSPEDTDGLLRLANAIQDCSVRRTLSGSRIGLVGQPSDWLVASSPAPETVRFVWGPTVIPISLEPLLSESDSEIATRGETMAREFRNGAETLLEPSDSDLLAAGKVYATLRKMVDTEHLDAVTVRCFDLVIQKQMTGCLALARLNDEGIIAGCEGDLTATVAMLWIRHMTGEIAWMANPARVDLERGILSLAHCTVPRTMTDSYRLRSHFESGLGAAIQGTIPTGPVTLVRIGGVRMEELRAIEGNLLLNTNYSDLCRTQVEVEVGRGELEKILSHPLGNHIVLVKGNHSAALKRWHTAMIS
jgi:L-fucose isomerase-like protein